MYALGHHTAPMLFGPTNYNGSTDLWVFSKLTTYYWCQPANGRFSSYNECKLMLANDLLTDNISNSVKCAPRSSLNRLRLPVYLKY
ncbi:Lysozyme 1 [Lucilia cuprina]|nr:Lysozyme 1 [Lucilia cuprina]